MPQTHPGTACDDNDSSSRQPRSIRATWSPHARLALRWQVTPALHTSNKDMDRNWAALSSTEPIRVQKRDISCLWCPALHCSRAQCQQMPRPSWIVCLQEVCRPGQASMQGSGRMWVQSKQADVLNASWWTSLITNNFEVCIDSKHSGDIIPTNHGPASVMDTNQ